MLSSLCAEIHPCLCSIAINRTFFKPVQLHLQLSNLLVQLRLQRFLARVWLRPPIREQFRRSLNRLPLPLRHLAGMHPVMRSNFLNGLLFLDGLQSDSCFHFRAEVSPLPRFHLCSLSEAAILHLNAWSEFWGALHYTSVAMCSKYFLNTTLHGHHALLLRSPTMSKIRA